MYPVEARISLTLGTTVEKKQELRRIMRIARQTWVGTLSTAFRNSAFSDLPAAFKQILQNHAIIGGYVAMPNEADPAPILHHAAHNGQTIALPYFADTAAIMEFRQWGVDEPLHMGPFGMVQPCAASPILNPTILLCPLIAFTQNGVRLGQGGGHYDCYSTQNPHAIRIGIGWSVQEVSEIPTETHDCPLHGVLTENAWIETRIGYDNG